MIHWFGMWSWGWTLRLLSQWVGTTGDLASSVDDGDFLVCWLDQNEGAVHTGHSMPVHSSALVVASANFTEVGHNNSSGLESDLPVAYCWRGTILSIWTRPSPGLGDEPHCQAVSHGMVLLRCIGGFALAYRNEADGVSLRRSGALWVCLNFVTPIAVFG